ncbi:hypothetical protein TTRE_0000518801 [Trichuris trichiura]|uniref:Cep192-like domain-containing protein n=1 Tax=Trichuris trichiura TaxID=36087 RepID=A0A077ZE13_TRITR|nr:hypothetical protein TTRE_0000518801 [Trichuris trichiura]
MIPDNFGKLALLKEAEDSFLPGGPNFTFETNSGFDCGYLQAHSDSVPAPRFLRSKFDFMDHLSEDGESPCMRLTVNVLPENTKSLPDENAEDGQKKCWSGNVSRENEDGIPDCMSLAGTKKVSESPPNAMRLVKFQGSQQLQHSEIQEEKDALAISTWLSGDEPSSKLELSPWARNLLDCTGPNNATRLAEWILKSNESLAARINPSGKTASKSPFENRNDGLKQKKTMESGCLLLFNAGEIQQLTASFCPQSVGFHSGKIVFVIEPTAEEFKICLNGWGGRAYISVTDNGAGCLLGNSRAWTLKLFRLSEGRFTGTFCVRNGGQLPAFVKIVPFRDSQFREPINDQSISIQPSKFVLCPGEREAAKVLLTTANNPNSDLIFLGIFWGEEVLRRNLRAAQTRKGKIYHVHGINFGELFDGELRCPISAAHFTRCDEGGLFNMGLQINTIRVVPEVSKLDSTDSFSAMDVNDTCLH